MDDLISRQQAIDAIGKKSDEIYKTKQKGATYPHDDFFQGMAYAESVVKELPSAQPERKTGRWIPTASGKGRHECSRCHEYAPCYQDGSEHLSTFCVLCGAKMERGEEE